MWFSFDIYDCGADGQHETMEGQVENCYYIFGCPDCEKFDYQQELYPYKVIVISNTAEV